MRKLRLVACNVEGQVEEDDCDVDEVFYSPRSSLDVPDHHQCHRPRRSFHRAPASASLSFVNNRRSFCYDRLNQFPIRFTVVKLDGSRFEIEVPKSGRIAELKHAVERAFEHMPSNEPDKISWQHVWGHFCLCYDGQKLVNDQEFIRDYGMREGDELRFVHHVSALKRQTKKHIGKRVDIQKVQMICGQHEAIQDIVEEADQRHAEDEVSSTSNESASMTSSLLKKFLLNSRPVNEKGRFKDCTRTSKILTGFIGCFKSMFHFHSNKTTCTPRIPGIET